MPAAVKLEEDPSGTAHDDPVAMQIDDEALEGAVAADEEDEIVREIDVFLSPQAAQELYLLQFPLQHLVSSSGRHQSSQRPPPTAARIKPNHNMLQLDYAIPTNYIEQRGSIHVAQRTFASHTVPVTTHLALGKITEDGKALHLAPLQHITQMRPTFHHIDDNDMENIRALEEQQEKAAAAQARLDRKPLMFQKKESERAAMARKNSYEYKKASEEGEHWIELQVLDLEDLDTAMEEELPSEEEIQQLKQQLICPEKARSKAVVQVDDANNAGVKQEGDEEDDNMSSNSTNQQQQQAPSLVSSYVRSLDYLPAKKNEEEDEFSHPSVVDWMQAGLDEKAFDLPTIGAHMTALLRDGWPIPYSILRQTLPPLVKDQDVLTALASCAVMLRGNYCLQSRLIPKLPKAVAKARTFIMLLLQSTGVVHRSRLDYVFGLSNSTDKDDIDNFPHKDLTPEIILMLLEQVGKKTAGGWILRGQDDVSFVTKFPQNSALHMQYWGRQMIRFQDHLQCYASAVAV